MPEYIGVQRKFIRDVLAFCGVGELGAGASGQVIAGQVAGVVVMPDAVAFVFIFPVMFGGIASR
jgi:hypothetical protein